MSNRLDQEREAKLQPIRVAKAKKTLEELGFEVTQHGETTLRFVFRGGTVNFFPYSGWHSGNTIQDGRGLEKLLEQLTEEVK